jgi:ribosomal protein S6
MKVSEYREGPEALKNFERGMKALFNVPRAVIVQAKKKKAKPSSLKKPKRSDKD